MLLFRTLLRPCLFLVPTLAMLAEDVPYASAPVPWDESLGNHRALVRVEAKADAVRVRIPWRRRDLEPEKKAIIIIDAATSQRVGNVLAENINREFGDRSLQPPTAPGEHRDL